jgi:23S rRNA pseudouridine955/2504/2580 synthase/23S rRNA pseudouridine1911/1915/1917 synthase
MKKFHFKVQGDEIGTSLLQFLKQKSGFSGKEVKRAIDAKSCTVNGLIERFSTYRLQKGDIVAFEKQEKAQELLSLYQDEYLSAFYKPPFYIVSNKFFFLHRLDKETSGVLLNSKEEAFLNLFRNREIEKTYYAICVGSPDENSGLISKPIVKDGVSKSAETSWKCIARKNGLSLIKCMPKTGRTHQIRIHLTSLGIPILGDHMYGKQGRTDAKRVFLHASKVAFIHPMSGKNIAITAHIPKDFLEFFDAHLYS